MKMPEPIIDPMISMVAENTPSLRSRAAGAAGAAFGSLGVMIAPASMAREVAQTRKIMIKGRNALVADAAQTAGRRRSRRGSPRGAAQTDARTARSDRARHRRDHRRRDLFVDGIGGGGRGRPC